MIFAESASVPKNHCERDALPTVLDPLDGEQITAIKRILRRHEHAAHARTR